MKLIRAILAAVTVIVMLTIPAIGYLTYEKYVSTSNHPDALSGAIILTGILLFIVLLIATIMLLEYPTIEEEG